MALEQFFGRIVDMVRVNDGDALAAAVTIGASTLTVYDVADFDETGGQLLFGGDVYVYDEVDPDANTIHLTTTVTVAGAIDDPVDAFDEELGQVVVEYVAHVLLDDQDTEDDPIEVTVQHALVPMLAESVRGGATETVTLLRDGDDDMVITQVDGKEAVDFLADAAVAAADEAFDQALAALTQAELALAISDGQVDIYYQTSAPWANGSALHDDDTGDIWVDTDASDTAYRWLNRTWTLIGDASIVAALLAAQSAQTTADGKIVHFVGPTAPTAEGYGDIWTESDNDNKKWYWDGDSWEPLLLGSAGIATLLIGKTVVAGSSATSGERVVLRLDGSGGILEFFSGLAFEAAPGSLNPTVTSLTPRVVLTSPRLTSYTAASIDVAGSSAGVPSDITLTADYVTIAETLSVHGELIALDGLVVSGGISGNLTGDVTGDLNGDITGSPTISGTVTMGSLTGSGGSSFAMVGNSGVFSRGVPISLGAADSGGVGFKMIRTPN